MKKIPIHFSEAFPWIERPASKMKVSVALSTAWLEKEIIRLIFRAPENDNDDQRSPLITALKKLDNGKQVSYLIDVAKRLTDAVIDTPLPNKISVQLKEINKEVKNLTFSLNALPKKNLPSSWNDFFFLGIQLIDKTDNSVNPKLSNVRGALKKARMNLEGEITPKARETHGQLDLVAILNLVALESKKLANANAIAFYKFPQTFFEEISTDNTLFLAFQRRSVQSIAAVNHEYFGKNYDAITAYILTCTFNKDILKQSVKKIRENLG